MRILILSDAHANPWALHAVEAAVGAVDDIFFAGDAVNYGPSPRETVLWLRGRSVIAVRGNHDHAVGRVADPRAGPAKQPIALAMRDWTRSQLPPDDLEWLDRLPLTLVWEAGGVRFAIMHATARDPLYDYRLTPELPDDEARILMPGMEADVIVCGHTHLPFVRRLDDVWLVNPGSVGQPLDGDPRAAYALWEDGRLRLGRVDYARGPVIEAIRRLPIADEMRESLAATLRQGRMM